MSRRPPPPPGGRPAPPPPDSPPVSDDDDVPPSDDEEELPPSDDEENLSEDGPPDDDELPPSDEGSFPGSEEMSGQEDEPSDEDPEEDGDFPEDEPDEDQLSQEGSEDFPDDEPGDDDEPEDSDLPDEDDVDGDDEPGSEGSEEDVEGSAEPSEEGDFEDDEDAEFDEEDEEPDMSDEDGPGTESEPDIEEDSVDGLPSDEEEPEDDEAPPAKGKKGGFKLPVKPATRQSAKSDDATVSSASIGGVNLDALSSGLMVKQPPKLLSKPHKDPDAPAAASRPPVRKPPPPPPSATGTREPNKPRAPSTSQQAPIDLDARSTGAAGTTGVDSSGGAVDIQSVSSATVSATVGASSTVTAQPAELVLRDPEVVRVEALANGYLEAQGKFEGDEFENLFVKVDTSAAILRVLIAQGLPIEFDLSSKAYVFEDSADPTSIILDYRSNIVVFKFATVDTLLGTMKKLPPQVFMVADLTAEEKKLVAEREAADKGKPIKAPTKGKGKYDASHTHGTSVEDLLEEDFNAVGESGKDQLEKMFNSKQSLMGSTQEVEVAPPPRRRAELAESHIRKPQYSVRRVTLLCEWINSLHIWPNAISINTLHREICNGLLLARIVKTVNPSVQFVNLNEKALAKKPALENLEQALGHIWRSKSLNNSRIPTANEIYVGQTAKTAILLNELFGAYVQKPLYKNALRILKWYHTILKQYSRPMPASTFEEGDLSTVWPHFQSGTALFCVIYHLFGPNLVGDGQAGRIRVDPLRVAGNPTSICDFRNNFFYVFTLLEALRVDVIWTPEDWISNPDTEFIMLQLSYIYEAFKHKQGALPPAQGATAGMTSGPNGEPLVVGMIFLDSRPANARLTTSVRKAVLLGHDAGSMPLLPVDRAGKTGRFISSVCPMGMVSNNAQISQISVALRENRLYVERTSWNQSAATHKETKETAKNAEVVSLLREHNKRNAADGSSTLTSLAAVPTSALVPGLGPGTLASGKLISQQYKPIEPGQTVDGGKVYSAAMRKIASDSHLQQTMAVKGQEIEVAVANLEEEMLSSQQQLNQLEDNLANRYLDLETSAAHISVAEYEAIFDSLEAERRELGEEKLKLQSHFARKLESIKDIYSEAEQRVRVNQVQQLTTTRVTHKGVTKTILTGGPESPGPSSPGKGKNAKSTSSSTKATTPGKTKPAINKTLAEKGWVSQLKPTAHNYHLKNLQSASQAATEAVWTPKYIKAKEAARKQAEPGPIVDPLSPVGPSNKAYLSGPALLQAQQMSAEELVAHAFGKFKKRLQYVSMRWVEAKNGGHRPMSVHEIMNSSGAVAAATLVSLPEKSFTSSLERDLSAEQREELAELARTIRQEESARMQYEDERRRLVIASQNAQSQNHAVASNSVPFSSASSAASGTSSHRLNQRLANGNVGFAGAAAVHGTAGAGGASAGAGHYSTDYFFDAPINLGVKAGAKGSVMHIAGKKPSQAEVDAAFKWLCIPRPLVIAERIPKEYVFALVNTDSGESGYSSAGETKSSGPKGGRSFTLEWREGIARAGVMPDMLAGCVHISDVKDITGPTGENDVFTLVIGSSAKALKNSKGRTIVSIKCTSPGECAKYLASLRCIRRSYDD